MMISTLPIISPSPPTVQLVAEWCLTFCIFNAIPPHDRS